MSSSPLIYTNNSTDEDEVEEEDDEESNNEDIDDQVRSRNDSDDSANLNVDDEEYVVPPDRFIQSWLSDDGTRRYFHHIENGRLCLRYIILPGDQYYNRLFYQSHREVAREEYVEAFRLAQRAENLNDKETEEDSNKEEE